VISRDRERVQCHETRCFAFTMSKLLVFFGVLPAIMVREANGSGADANARNQFGDTLGDTIVQ